MLRSSVNSPGNPWSQSWTRKKKDTVEEDLQKRKVLRLKWKSEGWWNTNINNKYKNVSSITTVSSLRSDHLALAVSVSQPRKSGTPSLHLSMHVPVLIPPSSPTTASRLSSPLNPSPLAPQIRLCWPLCAFIDYIYLLAYLHVSDILLSCRVSCQLLSAR